MTETKNGNPFTRAELFLTQSVINQDEPEGYATVPTQDLFENVILAGPTPAPEGASKAGVLVFADGSQLAVVETADDPGTYQVAAVPTDENGNPAMPGCLEDPEWAYIGHGQWTRTVTELISAPRATSKTT